MTAVAQPKFSPPPIASAIHRSRLFDRLSAYADARVMFILGQAAQGKSVLAATWLAALERPFAWINLDNSDKDPANFFLSLVQALAPHLSEMDMTYLTALPAVSTDLGDEPDFDKLVVPLRERLTTDVHIVVDDIEQLPDDAPLLGLLQALVTNGPFQARWMLLSRRMPPIAVEALNVKQQVLRVGNDQLAFTHKETQLFFRKYPRVALSSDQLDRIHAACEGWIGGMVLLNQALGQMDAKAQKQYLNRLSKQDMVRESGRYFDEVLLAALPEDHRVLMIHSAALGPIRAKVLQSLFPDIGVVALLDALAERHFFINRVSADGEDAVYRFHNLLRDHLFSLFEKACPADVRRTFYHKAAEALQEIGDAESAIAFFLKAEQPLAAALLVEQLGFFMVMAGRQADLKAWLNALEPALVKDRPWLLLLAAQANRQWGIAECFRYMENALRKFQKNDDIRGRLLTLGVFIDTMLITGEARIPLADLVAEAETLLTEANETDYPLETTLLWIQVGAAHAFRGGVGSGAIAACQIALQKATLAEHPLLLFKANMSLVLAYSVFGRFDDARQHLEQMATILRSFPYPELVSSHYAMTGVLCFMQGDTDTMETTVKQFYRHIADNKLFSMDTAVRVLDHYFAHIQEDDERIRELGHYLIEHSQAIGDQYTLSTTQLIMGGGAYTHQRYDEAITLLETAVQTMALPEEKSDDHVTLARVGLGLCCTHLGRYDEADGFLAKAETYYRTAENRFHIIDVHLARALWAHATGDLEMMSARLQQGFLAMDRNSYTYLLAISSRDLAQCAYLALAHHVPRTVDTATALLAGKLVDRIPEALSTLAHHPDAPVRMATAAVLLAQHRAQLPLLNLQCLGPFQVTKDGGETPLEFERQQPRHLLMRIAAREGVLPVEAAMEALWPESAPKKQKSNFKVTLHRLRKTLEPEMDKTLGSSYLHVIDNRLVLDQDRFTLDTRRFEAFCQQGDAARESGKAPEAIAHYRNALDLYAEDFLVQDLNEDGVEAIRIHLRNRFTQTAFVLAEMLTPDEPAAAVACLEKTIALDPFNEKAYRRLMRLHALQGDPDRMHAVYTQCSRALEEGLGVSPSAETKAIVKAGTLPPSHPN